MRERPPDPPSDDRGFSGYRVAPIEEPPSRVAPISWERHSTQLARDWRDLLELGPRAEQRFQAFLEFNPCMLPFAVAYTPSGTPDYGHHGTIHGGVFAQPRLPGGLDLRPDFLRITRDSRWTYVTLFELKWAGIELFRRDARFRDAFDAARAQLQGYATALEKDAWRGFAEAFQLPSYVDGRDVVVRLVLLAGRRSEVYGHPDRRDRRRRETIIVRSLDSLTPDANARDDMTLARRRTSILVKRMQPTMRLGPGNSDALSLVQNLPKAIADEPRLSPRRRAFLLERLPYWQSFAKRPGLLIHSAGYWE